MLSELINHTSTFNTDYYIEDTTNDNATNDNATTDNAIHDNAILVDTTRIIYTNTDSIAVSPDIDVKLRGGKQIFEMTKSENGKLSVNQCIETAMKK